MAISSVSFVGSGNLATHLSKAFLKNGITICQICSRNLNHATDLADLIGAGAITDLSKLSPVDLIIICVSDSAIEEVSKSLETNHSLIVHTSGSTSSEILQRHLNYGVLYPFQTFSKEIELDFSKVPLFIEANNHANLLLLNEFVKIISENVKFLNSEQRMKLHLAAVFANNFTNHMYAIAREILAEANLPFDILNHLIEETTVKAIRSGDPHQGQTGPAIRHNINILEQHKEIISNKPLLQKIYTFVSNSIMEWQTDIQNGTF